MIKYDIFIRSRCFTNCNKNSSFNQNMPREKMIIQSPPNSFEKKMQRAHYNEIWKMEFLLYLLILITSFLCQLLLLLTVYLLHLTNFIYLSLSLLPFCSSIRFHLFLFIFALSTFVYLRPVGIAYLRWALSFCLIFSCTSMFRSSSGLLRKYCIDSRRQPPSLVLPLVWPKT